MRFSSLRDPIALIAALLAPLAVAAALVPLRSTLPSTAAALVLVVVIVAVAANGHRIAGILAAASAAVWFDYFFTAPYDRFAIHHRSDIETTALLLVVGVAITEIAVRGRRQHSLLVTDDAYLTAVGTTTELVLTQANPAAVVQHVNSQLVALFRLRKCRFESGHYGGLPRLDPDGVMRMDGKPLNQQGESLPAAGMEIIAYNNGIPYGRFVLDPNSDTVAPSAARRVALMLVNQAGAALAREVTRIG